MARNVTLVLEAQQRDMPPGQTFAGFRFRLIAPSGASADSEITQETTWTFSEAAPAKYIGQVAAIDTAGQVMGEPVSIEVNVVEVGPGQTYPHPVGLSFVLS